MQGDLQNLEKVCDQISAALSLKVDSSNPDEIIGKIGVLTSLLSSSAYAVALANKLHVEKLMQLTEDDKWVKLSATDKKMVFAGRAKDEIFYVNLTDRQNKAITHAIDGLRSIISFLKAEMTNLPTN